MNRSALVKEICLKNKISISKLAKKIGQTPQNFNKKVLRNTISDNELNVILSELQVEYKQIVKFADGTTIVMENEKNPL